MRWSRSFEHDARRVSDGASNAVPGADRVVSSELQTRAQPRPRHFALSALEGAKCRQSDGRGLEGVMREVAGQRDDDPVDELDVDADERREPMLDVRW